MNDYSFHNSCARHEPVYLMMKTTNIFLLSAISFIASLFFVSCSDDDSKESNNSISKALQAKKWVYTDSGVNSYSYGYSYETTIITLYFIDESNCIEYGVFHDRDSDLGSRRDTWFADYTYVVKGNTITLTGKKSGSMTLVYYDRFLLLSDQAENAYDGKELTSSDMSLIEQHLSDVKEAEDAEAYPDAISKYVNATLTEAKWVLSLDFSSSLGSFLKNKKIRYGYDYTYNEKKFYDEGTVYFMEKDGTEHIDNLYINNVDFSIYIDTYRILTDKKAKGEALSDEEKDLLLKDLPSLLDKMVNYFDFDFFVEINGNKYYDIDVKTKEGNSEFDESPIVNGYTKCPDSNHPHAIDLGIGVKWACCNVGASSPEKLGGYYAWGETKEKKNYQSSTYKYFNSKSDNYQNIGSDIAGTQYDVAHTKWGGGWHIPSYEQIMSLINKCSIEMTSVDGVYGMKATGPNGGSVFFPAAGCRDEDELYDDGKECYYWSSTQNPEAQEEAYFLWAKSDKVNWQYGDRCWGLSVRPVTE